MLKMLRLILKSLNLAKESIKQGSPARALEYIDIMIGMVNEMMDILCGLKGTDES